MLIKIPATSANLGPGFDALGLSLKLFNSIEILEDSVTSVAINGEGSDRSYFITDNIFVKIFKSTVENIDKDRNFKFIFNNNIPIARGLGSSSAVIVGAIASAFHFSNLPLNRSEILNFSLKHEKHPDNIAPATFGGFVTSIVENGKVLSNKFAISDKIQAVVVIPNASTSTKKSRLSLPTMIPMKDCVTNLSHSAFLTSCFAKEDYDSLRLACKDTLHEKIRMNKIPELFRVRKIAYNNGAIMSSLSGSGSTFLNIAYKEDAIKLKQVLLDNFKHFRVEIIDFDNSGFEIV